MSLPNWIQSTDGSGKLSARVNSLLLALLPIILVICPLLGWKITDPEGGINAIVAVVAGIELIIAAIWHFRGRAQKNFRRQNKLGIFAEKDNVSM